jgi:hypothetical protein
MTVQALSGLKKLKTVSFHRRDRAAGASLELTSTITEKWGATFGSGSCERCVVA